MDYTNYVLTLRTLAVVPEAGNDFNFEQIIPDAINYAEGRIYREFDFLSTLTSQTATLTAGSRSVALPSNIIVTEAANVISPATTTNPDLGTRNPLSRTTVDFLNACFNSPTYTGMPTTYAIIGTPVIGASTITASGYSVLVGPFPDANYTIELIGTIRPSPLSPSNTTTFLSVNMPDLFLQASMIFVAGYQRDYGSQADDPKLAQSWSQQYDATKSGLLIEELRRKSQSWSWTATQPSPAANAPREKATP